ncbi:sulfatase-like hydrolase/transferase [Paludisphaera mucosa]|uniref:Sulfatase-like hydrolase/transferase n=1 Tax=Paludisphaera mucosa TaxID=3030827 RepID=A0ABT6F5U1_9BACT|nr:sulfatase-like hydrolase/transferase [Paludisphaera mucosa]MDG3002940.1 sulfatase-like hydrolase/transferase [Paludisphaera mucosa]
MRRGRYAWIAATVSTLAAWALSVDPASAADRPPNILLIVADDLGWGDVGFNGRTEWATPRLDRLASEGVVLKRCYAAAPICAPSRGAFLTGKYTIHSGVARNSDDLPAEQTTIAEALRPSGYATGLFGKWHHGRPRAGAKDFVHPLDQGFDEFFGYTDATAAWEKFPKQLWKARQKVPVAGYVDDLFTDQAIDFLDRRREKPFFLYVAYVATHFTIAAPADEVEKHRGKLPEPKPDQALSAAYAGMVTRLDANVGRLVDRIESLGLSNDTLVVFASDNGATFEAGNLGVSSAVDSNRPFRGQKRTLWEGGIRIPAFARWPGRIPAGGVSQEVTGLIDLLPTFAAAAGAAVDPSWRVDGLNVLPAWLGRGEVPGRTLFWEWRDEGAEQVAAMRGDFKLVVTRGGKPELYHVASDPAERRDVAAEHPELAGGIKKDLDAWLRTGGD